MTSAAPALTFDAERHVYRLNGRVVPSVTQILRAVLPGWQASEWHMQRGTATHLACRFLDEGRLDWGSVAEEIRPRVDAWANFRDQFPYEITDLERPVASARYQFAGTLDVGFSYEGKRIICDRKNTLSPQAVVQIGGYALAWEEFTGRKVHKGVGVELRDDGSYRTRWIDQHELRRAEQTFLACLTVYNFARANKLLKGGSDGDGND